MKTASLDLNVEADDDLEAVHFHLEVCPKCGIKNAPTNYYGSPKDCIEDGGLFKCLACKTQFKLLRYDYADEPEAVVEYED